MATKSTKTTLDKRRKYDDASKAEALRLILESNSTQAAVHQLGTSAALPMVANVAHRRSG
jgi:transposase